MQFWAEGKREEGALTWLAARAACADGSTETGEFINWHELPWSQPELNQVAGWFIYFYPYILSFGFQQVATPIQSVLTKWVYICYCSVGMKPFQTCRCGKGRWDMAHTVGTHKFWVVCRILNAESAQPVWNLITPISEDNFCVTATHESFLNLPLLTLYCAVPININRYGWNPMSSGIDCSHLFLFLAKCSILGFLPFFPPYVSGQSVVEWCRPVPLIWKNLVRI